MEPMYEPLHSTSRAQRSGGRGAEFVPAALKAQAPAVALLETTAADAGGSVGARWSKFMSCVNAGARDIAEKRDRPFSPPSPVNRYPDDRLFDSRSAPSPPG